MTELIEEAIVFLSALLMIAFAVFALWFGFLSQDLGFALLLILFAFTIFVAIVSKIEDRWAKHQRATFLKERQEMPWPNQN